jgi:homoserine dehydrogenase
MSDVSTQQFLEAASTLDEAYARRVAEAAAQGRVLRYVARVSRVGGVVGLAEVEPSSLLGALRGPANYFAFQTIRYSEEPLVVSGPGAGPDVTAAGVLGDIFDLALQHAPNPDYHAEEMQV